MTPLFSPRPAPLLPIGGRTEGFPVSRILCVGRNYAAHAAEMGNRVDRDAPFWFTKTPAHLLPPGKPLRYPPATSDLHHEVELVLALGPGGRLWGFAVGLDMTRRDLQAAARAEGKPWDSAKDWEGAAIAGPLAEGRPAPDAVLSLAVNGETRQRAPLTEMVHGIDALLGHLAALWTPAQGDLIFTGTPAGVGPVRPGDRLEARLDGAPPLTVTVADSPG
jgi:fumarylpyruvate hydrolase